MNISSVRNHVSVPAQPPVRSEPVGSVDTVELSGAPANLADAFAQVDDFARQNLGPDFTPFAIYGVDNYKSDGTRNPDGRLQFNMTGHLHGQPDKYSYVKVHNRESGTTLNSGPSPDKNNYHNERSYSAAELVDFDKIVKKVVTGDFGRKYPPSTNMKVELWHSDRLKQPITRVAWASDKQGVHWYCDMSFNPFTGAEVERDAGHA